MKKALLKVLMVCGTIPASFGACRIAEFVGYGLDEKYPEIYKDDTKRSLIDVLVIGAALVPWAVICNVIDNAMENN